MTDRKIYSRRQLHGLKKTERCFEPLEGSRWGALSGMLDAAAVGDLDSLYLVGPLEKMTREYCLEPLSRGWRFAACFTFKHRAPVYERMWDGRNVRIAVKLISHRESWFPGCADVETAIAAWCALESEWESSTDRMPLLSSPSKTGQALLWEMLPKGQQFLALPDDVERIVRANSPQHRIQTLKSEASGLVVGDLYQYDGRWMYGSLATLDRLPIGEPRRVGYFQPYEPGWHHVAIKIPDNWNHIGLIPILDDRIGWTYPRAAGSIIKGWVSESELTLALANGWEIVEHFDGYAFDKGRPLEPWASKLISMRDKFLWVGEGLGVSPEAYKNLFAGKAVRQILNHAIGSLHARGYERELFVSNADWKVWRRENAAWFDAHSAERIEGGWNVSRWVSDDSPLSINMPHWSATIWALERARVAQWALRCDPSVLVKINGDAIYSTAELPFEDNGRLGQLRRKR